MILEHIKVNGEYYYPQEAGVKDPNKRFSNFPVCIIKKRLFGFWQIDYHCERTNQKKGYTEFGDEDKPNVRLIVSPFHFQEIKYRL
jgi:hypothetical protein